MYGLSAMQKKALKKAVSKFVEDNKRILGVEKYPSGADELPEYLDIEAMHPTEVFWQEANRLVEDLYWEAK